MLFDIQKPYQNETDKHELLFVLCYVFKVLKSTRTIQTYKESILRIKGKNGSNSVMI